MNKSMIRTGGGGGGGRKRILVGIDVEEDDDSHSSSSIISRARGRGRPPKKQGKKTAPTAIGLRLSSRLRHNIDSAEDEDDPVPAKRGRPRLRPLGVQLDDYGLEN